MKKLNSKILVIVLIALVSILVLSRLFRAPSLESNLRKDLISLDTAAVDEIKIFTQKEEGEIKLSRQGADWKVANGQLQNETDRGLVNSFLGSIKSLKPLRLATRKKEKWEEFNVGDKGIHATVYSAGKKLADIIIGKTGFSQGGSYTYVRISDENETYAVEGFLESSFNRSYNDWRNKTILKLKKDDITKITYQYPADSGFVVEKRDSVWYAANAVADKNKVDILLNQLTFKNLTEFQTGFASSDVPTISVKIDGKAGTLITVKGWKITDQQWVINSTLQKDVYFSAPVASIFSDLLIAKDKLIAAGK
jgi:hypothetical protein